MSPQSPHPKWAIQKALEIMPEDASMLEVERVASALQETRSQALEEAANRCEQVTDKYTLIDDRLRGMRADIVSEECAREIRALKTKNPEAER